jgi:hypothetical protein
MGVGGLLGFPVWGGLSLFAIPPESPHPVALLALFLGVPLFMTGLSAWLLTGYSRARLIIRDSLVADCGVFQEKAIDLREVTEARWRVHQDGGSVVLRSGSERLVITFGNYEIEDRTRIIQQLRSVLPLEIQVDWNLYVYKVEPFEPRTPRTKPGPDEVLIHRNRWNRYFAPWLVVASLAGIGFWHFTGDVKGSVAFPVATLFGLVTLRYSTPAEGMVTKKFPTSLSLNPDLVHFFWFAMVWLVVALGGMAVNEYYRPRMDHVDGILIVGIVAWFAVLFYEAYLLDRRTTRRDREAADLAAKARGESSVDPWPSE